MRTVAVLVVLLGVLTPAVSGQTVPKSKKFLGGPLVIEDQGSFFVGGVQKITEHAAAVAPAAPGTAAPTGPVPQQITIGQMYVQFQIPAKKYGRRLAGDHGARLHPHRRVPRGHARRPRGLVPLFRPKGRPELRGRSGRAGRSGFDQSVIHEGEARLVSGDTKAAADLIPSFGRITDNGAWTAWFGHLVPAGSTVLTGRLIPHGDPADPNPKPDAYQHVAPLFPLDAVDAHAVSRTGALGPAPAAPGNAYALEYDKQLVPNAEVTLPGSTCANCDPKELSPANTWTPQNLAALVERLGGAIVVTHSQSGIMGHHMARILKERGHLDLLKGLLTLEGSCSLPNSGLTAADFDNIPYMALKGDYANTSTVCQETVDAINARRAAKQGTAKAEYLKLDDMGLLGVTHMMMLDKRNLEIADIMLNWVNKNVRASKR